MDEYCQPEAGLSPRDIEEKACRCNSCGSGLNSVEALVYGNRCTYCSPVRRDVSFIKFISNALLDFLIFRKTLAWRDLTETCPDCVSGKVKQAINGEEVYVSDCCSCQGTSQRSVGRIKLLGYIGAVGGAYWEELSLKQKWELWRS